MTQEDYEVGGTTALLDAIGMSIQKSSMSKSTQVRMNEQKKCYSSLQQMEWKIAVVNILLTK